MEITGPRVVMRLGTQGVRWAFTLGRDAGRWIGTVERALDGAIPPRRARCPLPDGVDVVEPFDVLAASVVPWAMCVHRRVVQHPSLEAISADAGALARWSGATGALHRACRLARVHHRDPTWVALAVDLRRHSPDRRQAIVDDLLLRLWNDEQIAAAFRAQRPGFGQLAQARDRMVAIGSEWLSDLDVDPEITRRAVAVVHDVRGPFADLARLYTDPITWSQRAERWFRVRAIALVLIRAAVRAGARK